MADIVSEPFTLHLLDLQTVASAVLLEKHSRASASLDASAAPPAQTSGANNAAAGGANNAAGATGNSDDDSGGNPIYLLPVDPNYAPSGPQGFFANSLFNPLNPSYAQFTGSTLPPANTSPQGPATAGAATMPPPEAAAPPPEAGGAPAGVPAPAPDAAPPKNV